MNERWETVIGMEIHVELMTDTKVFCGCPTTTGQKPNTQVCPTCLGLPGSLPVLNKRAFEYSLRIALALNCDIARRTQFERKNYYYPDLPKNYQISQLRKNLGVNGWINIKSGSETKKVCINNIHLEEDAGKNTHFSGGYESSYSLVDLNRAGTALMEIVTEPDMRSTDEVASFMNRLKTMLEYIEISDCNMHEGRLRFEANISVRPKGSKKLGTKVEVKNLNSMKFVTKCIEYETYRQIDLLESKEKVVQETRLWDESANVTRSMRSKEDAHDYRYFPDPDLAEVVVDDKWIEKVRAELPELPEVRAKRFLDNYKLPEYDITILINEKAIADYFENAVVIHNNPKSICNWITSELLGFIGEGEHTINEFPVQPAQLAELVKLIDDQTISGKIAKQVFKDMMNGEGNPGDIVKKKGLSQITDDNLIEKVIDEIIEANSNAVENFHKGNEKIFGFFVGQVMKATKGKANPKLVNELIRKKLVK